MSEKAINKRELEIRAELAALNKERDTIRSRKTWKCKRCERRTQISKLTLVQDHWYDNATYCEGWNQSKEVFIPCPKCFTVNRITDTFVQIREPFDTFRETDTYKLTQDYKRYFKEHVDYYPRGAEVMPSYADIEELKSGE